jgi:hypothetical protein
MTLEPEDGLASGYIPEYASVVHTASSKQVALWFKLETDNFIIVALESAETLSSVAVPYFGCFVEGASGYSVSERVVEGNAVDHILVAFQGEDFLPRCCLPHFTGTVIRASDEEVPVFVESTVC